MIEPELSRTAGECAVPVETVVPENVTVEEAMSILRERHIHQKIIYFYAVDEKYCLKGVVSTRQLLLAEPTRKIEDIMQNDVLKIYSDQSLKEALELFAQHPLLALPVVDKEGKLLGAVDVQMVIHEPLNITDEKARFDTFQMIGITLEERRKVSIGKSYMGRMPWLLCNVFSGLICAIISRVFEEVLAHVLILAFFIPLVLTLSESTSMQLVAQSLQLLKRPRFHWRAVRLRALKEWKLVVLLGVTLGFLVGILSLFWQSGILPSVAIGMGIMVSVSASAVFGIFIPILLNRMRLDPRVASGPVVLMIVDILTTAVYLGFATWWLL